MMEQLRSANGSVMFIDSFFRAWRKMCNDGALEREDMPEWTRTAIARLWQEVPADVEARNTYAESIVWRHVVGE